MAEQVGSAAVGEVVSRTASFLTNKLEQLFGVSEKVKQLEFKVIKICSVIEESKKYYINNKPLLNWQRQLIDAVQEGECLLLAIKDRSTATARQSPTDSGSRNSLPWQNFLDFIFSTFVSFVDDWKLKYVNNVFLKKEEIAKLNRSLERLECISSDIGIFLELIRMQKRRRGRRKKYRPYLVFSKLIYLQLVYDSMFCVVIDVVLILLSIPKYASFLWQSRRILGSTPMYACLGFGPTTIV
jgi:hypothetical protein